MMDHLINSLNDCVLVISTDGTIRTANPPALELLGYPEKELLAQPLSLLFDKDDSFFQNGRAFSDLLKKGNLTPRATRCRTNSGVTFPVTISMSVLYTALGVEKGIICLIKEMNRTDPLAELHPSSNFFKTIIDSLPDSLMILDSRNFTILAANAACLSEVGLTEDEVLGRPCHAVMHKTSNIGTPPEGGCPMLETLSAEKFSAAEQVFCRDNAVVRIVEVSTAPIFDSSGQVSYILHLSRDITARRQHEEEIRALAGRLEHSNGELQQANDDLKSFASIVSHDMRSPLVSIKGFAGELEKSCTFLQTELAGPLSVMEEDRRRQVENLFAYDIPESLQFISSSINRLDSMINSILKLSRIGYRTFEPELVDTGEIVQGILASLQHQLDSKQVSLSLDRLPTVEVDRVAIGQIFGNLLDNALKYLDPSRPGALSISAVTTDGQVTFRVQDNGRGIAVADLEKVFLLFRRVGRQDVAGEGMGLAYVKTLVRRLGGTICCESVEGSGSTFSFTMPLRVVSPENAAVAGAD
jgi:PAS domain S-box-containing protein